MRTRHWLRALVGGLLWGTTAAVGQAQTDFGGPGAVFQAAGASQGGPAYSPGMPAPGMMPPPMGAVPYGVGPAGWPQGGSVWPQISPYEAPPVDQHSYQDGFWFNTQKFGGRKYYANLNATLNRYSDPQNTRVGNPNAVSQLYPITTGTGVGAAANVALIEYTQPASWRDIRDPLSGGGVSGQIGFFEADDSGWQLNGFWAGQAASFLRLGEGVVDNSDPSNPIVLRPIDTLEPLPSLPLLDGVSTTNLGPFPPNTVPTVIDGSAQYYDLFYRLEYSASAIGTGATYFMDPAFERGKFKVRPLLGMRYLKVDEQAAFNAAWSGYRYTFNLGSAAGGGGAAATRGPTGLLQIRPNPWESFLGSNVESHLAGPEAGFRIDMGSDRFLITSLTKVGLMANHSKRQLDGYGIGVLYDNDLTQTAATLPAWTQADTVFSTQDTTTSASPVIEQAFNVRAPLLAYVPYVNKMKVFEAAQFQMGYSILVLPEMYRPGNVINWQGYPRFPSLQDERATFFISSYNFGVEWNY